jgi:hypothetical protein
MRTNESELRGSQLEATHLREVRRLKARPRSLELKEALDKIEELTQALRKARSKASILLKYKQSLPNPLVSSNKIVTLKRQVARRDRIISGLKIDEATVLERMREDPIWLDFCFEPDDHQAIDAIVKKVLDATR